MLRPLPFISVYHWVYHTIFHKGIWVLVLYKWYTYLPPPPCGPKECICVPVHWNNMHSYFSHINFKWALWRAILYINKKIHLFQRAVWLFVEKTCTIGTPVTFQSTLKHFIENNFNLILLYSAVAFHLKCTQHQALWNSIHSGKAENPPTIRINLGEEGNE